MESYCTRGGPGSARRWLLVVALAAGLVAVLSVGALAVSSHIVYQRSIGQGCLWAYSPAWATDRPLYGTEKMADCIIGDLDGDGAEDEIVYRTGLPNTIGYYKIPADGQYHPENDHLLWAVAQDPIPQTIIRQAATGWGTIIYKSEFDYASYALFNYGNDTWQDLVIGQMMDKAFAADLRNQGFKGDLFYQIGTAQPDPSMNYFQYGWREGFDGDDHIPDAMLEHPNYQWDAYGVGKLIPNRPDSVLVFYTNIPYPGGGGNVLAVCDATWNFTVLDGTNGAWGPAIGRPYLHFGQVDDNESGLDSIVFCNGSTAPLQFYRPGFADAGELIYPDETSFLCDLCLWDTTYYVNTDPEWPTGIPVRDGCFVKGVASGVALAPREVTPVEHIADIRLLPVGECVSLSGMLKTLDAVQRNEITQETLTTGFYIEEPSRVAGIRVDVDLDPVPAGSRVSITGQIANVDGELVLVADVSEVTIAEPEVMTFAIHPDGTGRTMVGKNLDGSEFYDFYWPGETGVAAGDVLGTGVKNDLLYVAPNGDLMWREGISGPEHLVKSQHPERGPYWPLATGYVLPDKPDNRIFAVAGWAWYPSDSNAYCISTSGDVAEIWEITSNWGSMDITRMDANRVGGTDDVLFYNHALQWSKISWDSANSRYIHDPNGYWIDLWTIEDTGAPTKFGQYNFGATNAIQRARLVTPDGTTNCIAGKLGPAPYRKSSTAKTLYYVPNEYAYGVWPGPAGTVYQMDESERMFLPRCVDIDGDGMDDIIYHDNDTGEMCWYKMTSEWLGTSATIPWNPDNVHKITSYGLPLAVLEPAGEKKDILFYDTVTVRPVGTTAKALYGPGLNLNGMLVTVAGRVTDADPFDGTFTVSDGSPLPLTVACPDPALPDLNGVFVTLTGCVGAETAGASTVPVIRVPSASYIH